MARGSEMSTGMLNDMLMRTDTETCKARLTQSHFCCFLFQIVSFTLSIRVTDFCRNNKQDPVTFWTVKFLTPFDFINKTIFKWRNNK